MEYTEAKVELLLTEVDMQNELFNPFPSSAGQFLYMDKIEGIIDYYKVPRPRDKWEEDFANDPDFKVNALDFKLSVRLGSNIQIIERTRYNVWDLLGDVGGLNDGLHLLGSFLFSSYAAFSFK